MEHRELIKAYPNSDNVILFIHGICGTPNHFAPFLPLVPDDWSVYNVLLDGHGKGVDDFAASSMAKWKEQIRRIVEDLCSTHKNVYICAHSMGTLFAMEEALRYPNKIRGLMLLASPLKIFLKPLAVLNSTKVIFNAVKETDEIALAGKYVYGIAPDPRLWKYLKWIPRYLELFREVARVRENIRSLTVPCVFYQSRKDELVSMSSVKYMKNNPNVSVYVLERSHHFHYNEDDLEFLKRKFAEFITL